MNLNDLNTTVASLTNRVAPMDFNTSNNLMDAAMTYALTYQGNFGFMLSLRDEARRYARLTPNQAAGALNCARAEFSRANYVVRPNATPAPTVNFFPAPARGGDIERANQMAPNPVVTSAPVAAGTYTVVMGDVNNYRTLRLQAPKAGTFTGLPAGTLIVGYLSGPDNERNFTNFGFLFADGRVAVWGSQRNNPATDRAMAALTILKTADSTNRSKMGLNYALRSNRCCKCGRTLTVPTSVHQGMGPECASRS